MAKREDCYTEEQIVDMLLNNLPPEEQVAFQAHCQGCTTCQALASEWQETLAAARVNNCSIAQEKVKEQLWSKLQKNVDHKSKGVKSWLRPKPIAIVGTLGTFLLLVLLMDLFPSSSLGSWPDDQDELALVQEEIYYSVRSTAEPLVDGYVTINPHTDEVYIFVQGVPMVVNQDYQAWLMEEKSPIDMGLLRLENGAGELYKQTKKIKRANILRISIEPKGGSLYPTGSDFIFIPLDQR